MAISYLPASYDDELIYSRIARAKAHLGCSYSGFFQGLNADTFYTINFHFGANLSKLRSGFSNDFFSIPDSIQNNSLLPFLSNFIPKVRCEAFRDSVSSCKRIIGTAFFNLELKFCPLCSEEDRNNLGETYWRRTFAVNTWCVCHVHGCYLQLIPPTAYNIGLKHLYNAEDMIPKFGGYVQSANEDEIQISKRIASLVNGEQAFSTVNFLDALKDRNLVHRGCFEQEFVSERNTFMRSISTALPGMPAKLGAYAYQRLRNQKQFRIFDPALLLVTEYFVESKDFKCSTLQYKSVTLSNCPCGLNSRSIKLFPKYHGKNLRTKIVYCPNCKFTYFINEKDKLTRVVDYGSHLRTLVSQLINDGLTLEKIGKQLGFTVTVIKGLKIGRYKRGFMKQYFTQRKEMRRKFIELSNTTFIEKATVHQWLTRYDREWLYSRPRAILRKRSLAPSRSSVIPKSILEEARQLKNLPIRRFLGYEYMKMYFRSRLRGIKPDVKNNFYLTHAETVLDYVMRTSYADITKHFGKGGTIENFNIMVYAFNRTRKRKLSADQMIIFIKFLECEIGKFGS